MAKSQASAKGATPKKAPASATSKAQKPHANVKAGQHYTEIDTTGMSPEQVAAVAEQAVQKRKPALRNKNTAEKPKGTKNPAKHGESVKSTSKGEKKPIGRPSEFNQEKADLICEALAEGHSLRKICLRENTPSISTVCRWLATYPEFQKQYARAREQQADALFDEMLEIADDGTNDTYMDEDGNPRTDHDVIARSRLRVETRKWMAGKLKPKVYGDKVDVNHGVQPENPLAALLAQVNGSALPVAKDGGEE